ncbi:MAG: hypothetical protein AAB513_01600 [Patescibacteria group bacterium]
MKSNFFKKEEGVVLVQVLVFATVSVIIMTGLVGWAGSNVKAARLAFYREQAFQIAEAGIEYYRWHLAHDQDDFQDGTGVPGPYIHNYLDKDENVIGTFTLEITPPVIGSTVVTVRSTGTVNEYPSVNRKLEVRMAIPSWARYAVAANADMRFGNGTEVFGPLHSNGGIRFDGLAHNIISSSRTDYNDPDHSGNNEFGVHTHTDPSPPANPAPPNSPTNGIFRANEAPPTNPVPTRNDIFQAGRQFPVPAVDFAGITTDLASIKTQAQAAGFYRAGSGALGYRVLLRTDDTFDLYRVNTLRAAPNNCTNTANQATWGTWSIATGGGAQALLGNYAIPANGLVFLEDSRIWVEGQINTARVTIAASRFSPDPNVQSQITVNNNLLYTNYDGQDTISMIAENNFNVGLFSLDVLRIDGAIVAQLGRAGRYYYESDCSPNNNRNTLTLYGMIATSLRYGFAYTDGSGYNNRNIIYDANLLYAPPPSFPLTSDQYSVISWQEIK